MGTYCCVTALFGWVIMYALGEFHSFVPAIVSGLCFAIWLVGYAIDYGDRDKGDWKKYCSWKLSFAVVAFGAIMAVFSWFVFRAMGVQEMETPVAISAVLHWGLWLAIWLFLFVISNDDELKWTRHNLITVPIAGAMFCSAATIAANVDLSLWLRVMFSLVIPLVLYVNCYRCLFEMTFLELLKWVWDNIKYGINQSEERRSRASYHTYYTEEHRGGIDFLGILDVLTSNDEETTRRYGFNEFDIKEDHMGERYIDTHDGRRYLDENRPDVYHGVKYDEKYDQFGNRIDD